MVLTSSALLRPWAVARVRRPSLLLSRTAARFSALFYLLGVACLSATLPGGGAGWLTGLGFVSESSPLFLSEMSRGFGAVVDLS